MPLQTSVPGRRGTSELWWPRSRGSSSSPALSGSCQRAEPPEVGTGRGKPEPGQACPQPDERNPGLRPIPFYMDKLTVKIINRCKRGGIYSSDKIHLNNLHMTLIFIYRSLVLQVHQNVSLLYYHIFVGEICAKEPF